MIVTYEIELDSPDYFAVVEAEDTATKEELLNLAIEEMTRNTTIWKIKKFDKVKGF